MLSALIACAFWFCAAVESGPRVAADYTILTGRDTMQPCSLDNMVTQLTGADVVFVGENHDHKQGHALELMLLTELHRRNPAVVLSLEMFERDVQGVVDEYLHDYITETSFLQAARPWPNYKDDYRPLVEFCKENHLPVVAANAPRRYVNIVSRKGREGLNPLPRAAKSCLAPLPYSMAMPSGYSRQLDEIFGAPHGMDSNGKGATPTSPTSTTPAPPTPAAPRSATPPAPPTFTTPSPPTGAILAKPTATAPAPPSATASAPPSATTPAPPSATTPAPPTPAMPSPANLKAAQALWDATMADSIVRAVRNHPGHKVLQINGCMHSDSGYGIADRLHKLRPALKILIVTIKPDADYPNINREKYKGFGDCVIVTPK